MNTLTPLVKGMITGVTMAALTLGLYYADAPALPVFQILLYVIYAAGIAWTLLSYYRSTAYTGKFGDLFSQGFRCFIIVVLIMTAFTGIFSAVHPEFAEAESQRYKEYLLDTKKKDKTPAEINEMTVAYKKHYTTSLIYTSIFRYLIVGAFFTAVGAGLSLTRRKEQ